MNIIEAVEKAQSGYAIMCLEQKEWIISSGGHLRWKSNRQPVHLTIGNIMSKKWISEDELITVSRIQIEDSLKILEISDDKTIKQESINRFFEQLISESYANNLRRKVED